MSGKKCARPDPRHCVLEEGSKEGRLHPLSALRLEKNKCLSWQAEHGGQKVAGRTWQAGRGRQNAAGRTWQAERGRQNVSGRTWLGACQGEALEAYVVLGFKPEISTEWRTGEV